MSDVGQEEMQELIEYYMANANSLRAVLTEVGRLEVYGGVHCPYLWVRAPPGQNSWQVWETFLKECHIVTTPGVGFGSEGEGFLFVTGDFVVLVVACVCVGVSIQ